MKNLQQYKHNDKDRLNNPPVGLVNEYTDKDYGQEKKKYTYDPHLDPELGWDNNVAKAKANEKFNQLKQLFEIHAATLQQLQKEIDNLSDNDLRKTLLEQQQQIIKTMKAAESLFQPSLKWAGKAENTSFEVKTLSLHIHEKIDPNTIIENLIKDKNDNEQLSMFETEQRPLREAIDFYKHKNNWANRLVAGDSLLVMNSLIQKESMGSKVQMIYFDPPYGISYGSNFQPFTNQRSVNDKDEDLTQEPEMIKAFRDTWELGIHSYLSYIRDRLLLAKTLLHESGSIFVQISDENVHHVREILDEVFGKDNFVSMITFRKKTGVLSAKYIGKVSDYIIWYSKNINKMLVNKLFEKTLIEGDNIWSWIQLENGEKRKMTKEEINNHKLLPKNAKVFRLRSLSPAGFNSNTTFKVEYKGKMYNPPKRSQGASWAVNKKGIEELIKQNRVMPTKNGTLDFVYYFDDFPVSEITNLWSSTRGASNKIYVVQTDELPIQKCILMTTNPGDLVMDITCGSGTTAYVAEQWGRRWITCDTSRVALVLAKQRLMTAVFDYYELAHPTENIGSGFKYKKVPHISVGQIANKEPYGEETLYDQPFINKTLKRVTSPFTVEAIPSPIVKSLENINDTLHNKTNNILHENLGNHLAREGETYRQKQWQEELARTGVRMKNGEVLRLQQVKTLSGTNYIQAYGLTIENSPKKVFVSFGPEHAAMDTRQVEKAIDEAGKLKPDVLLFCAFQFDEEAAKDIDETNTSYLGFKLLKAQMNMDLQTEDLKKNNRSNQSFWLVGQPDVSVVAVENNKLQVQVHGFDYYNYQSNELIKGGAKNIAMWLLDTDYDGRSLFPRQVFFPMVKDKEGWYKLAKTLKADIDTDKIEAFHGTQSLPFELGKNKTVAVKIIDDRGIESLKIIRY
jgi:adenine-specific DNA-methyltransferase